MAKYNESLTWVHTPGNEGTSTDATGGKMPSWGTGGTDYCNFGYSNVVRNGNQITFNWDLYVRQTGTQSYDRWALGSDQLGVSNGTIKGYGSSWQQYPLGYYNYSNNNGATSQGGADSYSSPKTATVTVPSGQNYVDISVIIKNTGLNSGWVTPWGDSSTYPNVTKTFRISNIPAPKNKSYVKVNGTWKQGDTYVKVNGVWKLADAVYTKVNGSWKESS